MVDTPEQQLEVNQQTGVSLLVAEPQMIGPAIPNVITVATPAATALVRAYWPSTPVTTYVPAPWPAS